MKLNFSCQKTAFDEFFQLIRSYSRNWKLFTLQLVLTFLLLSSGTFAQTKSFSFTEIPFSDPDIIAPFRGSEIWYNEFTIQLPTGTGTNINPQGSGYVGTMNQYWRFPWRAIQNDDGSYNWTVLDSIFKQAIRNKRKLGIGIMQLGGSFGASTVGGKYLTYPLFVHNQMQGEANPDYPDGDGYPGYNQWYPNVNSNFYQSAWANMLLAVANRINTTSFMGVLYADVLQYVDIRGHGFYGEWNGYNASTKPAAMSSALIATPASLIKLVDAAKTAFPNHQLVAPIGAYYGDQGTDSGSPPEVGYYILTTSNNFGKIGVRRDHWGQNSFWMPFFFENNNSKFNGIVFKDSLMARWKIAPIMGEPSAADVGGGGGSDGPVPYYDLPRQVRFYHATSFGNGNYGGYNVSGNAQIRDSVRMASKLSGYRLTPSGGTMTDVIASNSPFSITVNWKNIGVAPVYDNWNIWYELRDATEKVIWSDKSSFKLRLFLPATTATAHVDNFTLPAISGSGLKLVMIIKDPKNYLPPLPLSITGRQADGSYILRTGISIQTGTASNQAPTANAGTDQVITLPITSATISGSGSDVDGTITSFNWTKINGPASATIESANTASTKINGLAEGQYTFRLTVTDNAGASTSDDINIIVNKASGTVTNGISVNAGDDQVITLPQSTVTLVSNASKTSTVSPDVNLILIWGESNASGAAPNNQGPTAAELAPRSAVKVLNNSNLTFENIDIGTNHNIDNFSSLDVHAFELGLTNEVEAGRLTGPVYLVKAAKSGSRIDEWQPGQEWWNKMKLRMDAAVAYLKSQGKSYQITIWASIGLNDFVQNTTAATYTSRMQNFYSSFRALYGSNVVALQTRFVSYHPYNPTINAIDAADPNTYAIDVNGAPFLDQDVHWNYDGYKLIANRMVTTMKSISPSVSSTINYVWSKVSGPTGGTIKTPNSATTDISGLTAGTYVFRNTVSDNTGGTAFDEVQIIVKPDLTPSPPNQLPFVTAGNDQSVTLPANTTTLNGSATDPDGTIASYAWSKISGPAGGNLQTANTASTNITGLNAGTYVFRLTVTDNAGAVAADDIQVIVTAAPLLLIIIPLPLMPVRI